MNVVHWVQWGQKEAADGRPTDLLHHSLIIDEGCELRLVKLELWVDIYHLFNNRDSNGGVSPALQIKASEMIKDSVVQRREMCVWVCVCVNGWGYCVVTWMSWGLFPCSNREIHLQIGSYIVYSVSSVYLHEILLLNHHLMCSCVEKNSLKWKVQLRTLLLKETSLLQVPESLVVKKIQWLSLFGQN